MKIKKFNKKLSLNKESIANLATTELNDVKGGRPPIIIIATYYTCNQTCLCTVETVCHVTECS
jgi:natural product precursor